MSGIESLLIGRTLGGRYRIEEVIGRGGMGAVYRAVDERLGRQVALKVITVAGMGDPAARERLRARFFREARSAAALPHHPNVVPVYDYGSDEALDLDYLVMELLRGSDLASRLSRSGPPPLPASLRILLEAIRGVAVGHAQGLIHRDVKPGNIFLTRTPHQEVQVRVVDFGIAKLADDEDTLAQLTQDGRVPHSPAYASPEQLRGLGQLTPASDVFSLGAVGFQLLTGERPFSESDRNRLSLGMPAPAPSLRAHNASIPGAVESVIQRALAFEPTERYSDAAEMAADLERAIRGLSDVPLEPYLGGAPSLDAERDEDRIQLDDLDDDRTRVAESDDDRTFLAPPPSEPLPRRAPTARVEAKAVPAKPERPARLRRGAGGVVVWSLVLTVLAAAAFWGWSELDSAPASITLDLPADTVIAPPREVEPAEPETPTSVALLSGDEGLRFFRLGQYDSALVHFQRAVEVVPSNPEYRLGRGATLLRLGRAREAVGDLTRAIQLDPGRATTYFNLAEAQLALQDTTQAIRNIEEYMRRESDPGNRQIAQQWLGELRRANDPDATPLLGDPVLDAPPGTDSPPGDSPPLGQPGN